MPQEQLQSNETIDLAICPVCGSVCRFMHAIKDLKEERSLWYHCKCGVVFQDRFPLDEKPADEVYKKEYADNYLARGQKHIDESQYPVRLFAPLIEEMTYGRKMLEVGFNSTFLMQAMRERGWLTWGIDYHAEGTPRLIKGDFETYDFTFRDSEGQPILQDGKEQKMMFNLIWMSHVLEHFRNPVAVLKKCYNLMPEDGVLYIATPDTDFIHTRHASGFPHWKKDEHYIMFNRDSLVKSLEEIGFDVVMSRRNYEQRFSSWDDIQILAQKKFY